MKRFLLIVSVLFVSLQLYSQEQGKWYVGGKVGFDVAGVSMSIADSYDTINSTTATMNSGFGIEGGYFLTDKVKVGLGFEQSSSNSDNTSVVVLKSLYGSLAYYKEIVDGLYYVPEFKIGIVAGGSITMEDLNIPLDGMYLDLSLVQLEFKPTEHFSTAINLGYTTFASVGGATTYQRDSVGLAGGIFTATLGITPSVTFKYYF